MRNAMALLMALCLSVAATGWAAPPGKAGKPKAKSANKAPVETPAPAEPEAPAEPKTHFDDLLGEDWYGIYLNGQKAGYARNGMTKTPTGGYEISEDARFMVNMAGVRQDMHITTNRSYAGDGALLSLKSQIESFGDTTLFEGTVQGESLLLRSVVGGATKNETLPRPKETLGDAVKYSAWILNDPALGDSLDFSIFEPMYGKEISAMSYLTEVGSRVLNGVATPVYKIETTMELVGLKTTSYVTDDGTVLEDVIAGNMTMRLEPEEVAKNVDYSNDVIVSNAAMLDAAIDKPRTRDKLRLKIAGPLDGDHLVNEDRQKFTPQEGFFLFESQRVNVNNRLHPALPIAEETVKEWLLPTTYVQSDNAAVVAKAKEIVGAETDSWLAAQRILTWVDENMRSKYSARLTNTLEVLQSLEGDCTEHSILFVGLARAAGIPAREVAGLVYVQEGGQPGFYFHQWAKVWVGEWVDMDPAFGQTQVDVTHIKLGEGDLIEQARLLPVIGQLKIEVLPDNVAPAAPAKP
jgi:hypothetical protein